MKRWLCLFTVCLFILHTFGCTDANDGPAPSAFEDTMQITAPVESPIAATPIPTVTEAEPIQPVTRLIVFETACQTLSATEQMLHDETVPAYAVRELLEAQSIAPTDTVCIIGSNGFQETESYELFLEKYIAIDCAHAPILVGEAQDADWAVWNMMLIRVGACAIIFSYQQEDISLGDLFALTGMAEADAYTFTCSDGYRQDIPASDIPESYLTRIDGRYDAKAPSLGAYTLFHLLSIAPSASTEGDSEMLPS